MSPGDSLEISNFFESEEYLAKCKKYRNFYELGYLSPDAVTDETLVASRVAAGDAMSYEMIFGVGLAEQESKATGREMIVFVKDEPYLLSSDFATAMPWVINSNTEVAEASMKLLNELYTDPVLCRTLSYGIEGRDYIVNENDMLEVTDDLTPQYSLSVSWMLPGQFIAGTWEGNSPDTWIENQALNDGAIKSKAIGFIFDQSSVTTEYTALSNIYKEYQKQLEFGFIDPEEGIAELNERLKASGLEKYMSEKQSQLDAWAETQN